MEVKRGTRLGVFKMTSIITILSIVVVEDLHLEDNLSLKFQINLL